MKPAPFDYIRPESKQEALQYLQGGGPDIKILAGGQSLVPLFNMRLAEPERVMDINGIAELARIRYDHESHTVEIGALTRHHQLIQDPVIQEHLPMLAEAAQLIGHLAIRTRGTFGGSLVHADPAAELPMMVAMLRGVFEVESLAGPRQISAEDFFLGFYMTDLQPEELVVAVRVPVPDKHSGYAIREFSRRHGDFAIAAAAAVVRTDTKGRILHAALGVGGLDSRGVSCPEIETLLVGASGPQEFRAAAERLPDFINPADDVQASADFRRHLGIELLTESIEAAHWNATHTKSEVIQ